MSFRDIIGHERALRILRGMVGAGKPATTYLFSGEKGIGKSKTALEFAKALNCENGTDGDPCDTCRACRKISSLNHPDIMLVTPENGVIKIERIRDIEDFLSFMPYEGNKKVVIVDDADMMNRHSENAFLKTLEEPPENSVIILVSSRREMLVDTIRSRCFNIKFGPLSEAALREAANAIGGTKISEMGIKLAMGRMGLLFDEGAVERRDILFNIFEDMIYGRGVSVPKEREVMDEWIDYFILFIRDMAVFSSTGKREVLFNVDLSEKITGMCKETDLKGIIKSYRLLHDLKKRTAYNLNKSILCNYLSSLLSSMGQKGVQ